MKYILFALLLISGCSTVLSVQTYSDSKATFEGKTFFIAPLENQKNQLDFKSHSEKLIYILKSLEMKEGGNSSADYKIFFDYGIYNASSSTSYFNSYSGTVTTFQDKKAFLNVDIYESKTNKKVYEVKISSQDEMHNFLLARECLLSSFALTFPSANETIQSISVDTPCNLEDAIKLANKKKDEMKLATEESADQLVPLIQKFQNSSDERYVRVWNICKENNDKIGKCLKDYAKFYNL
jgi:hypothetical protein